MPFDMSLLEATAESYVLTPHDWKALLHMVLTPTQFTMWQSDFKEQFVLISMDCLDQGHTVPYEQLAEENAFAAPPVQAHYRREVYAQIQTAALGAVGKTPESGHGAVESFAKIVQGPTETYSSFIHRFQAALAGQIEHDEARKLLLKPLAYENANDDCKCALQPSRNRNPTLADMVRACQHVGSTGHHAAALANALTAQFKISGGTSCYQCSAPRHLKTRLSKKGQQVAYAPS